MSHVDPRSIDRNAVTSQESIAHSHGHPTIKTFIFVWIALLVGTGLTVLAASYNLGVFSPIVALLIATIKAVIVILFFMEIKYSSKLTMTIILAAFFFLGLLLVLTMMDYITRAWNTHAF
jgi:cytochrome c oxidase subunit IV